MIGRNRLEYLQKCIYLNVGSCLPKELLLRMAVIVEYSVPVWTHVYNG
jgi:hypothetical protein